MKFTNLVLGRHLWKRSEWPESVVVSHEGQRESVEYVPERTCTRVPYEEDCIMFGKPAKRGGEKCSACGHKSPHGNYCSNCGARIVEDAHR